MSIVGEHADGGSCHAQAFVPEMFCTEFPLLIGEGFSEIYEQFTTVTNDIQQNHSKIHIIFQKENILRERQFLQSARYW